MNTETFKIEIEGKDGVKRVYSINCDELLRLIEKNVNYHLVLEG